MNWYKISQQMSFNFPEAPSPVKEPEQFTSVEESVDILLITNPCRFFIH
jgi:hypothetical protein